MQTSWKITHKFVFLNYLLGMNFATSIAYINGDSGARECCVFSKLNDKNPPLNGGPCGPFPAP